MALVFPQAEITGNIGGTGLSSRRPARAGTITSGTLSTSFANGSVVDGITLATGDRILIKNQTSTIENGVYEVNAVGAPSRATDYDEGDKVGGSFLLVAEGTTNGGTGWLCTNALSADVVGTNALTFKLISGDISGTSSTDNAIVRWDGITGTKVQNSAIIIDDNNNMTGLQYLQFSDISAPANPSNAQGRLYKKTGNDGLWWRPDSAGAEVDLTASAAGSVVSFQTSLSGLTPNTSTTGSIILAGTLGATSGGTGTSTAPTSGQMLVGTSGGSYVPYTVTTGTGISTTTGSGTFQINNTGATSIAGTTNQITASAATGAITLSTPSTFIAPGTIASTTSLTAGTLFYEGTSATVSAAGTTQGTATALTNSYNIVTTVASSTGVALPTPATAGLEIIIVNKGANTLNVYPASGGAIDSAGTNAAVTLPVNGTATYQAATTTQWYTVRPVITAGTNAVVTYSNGSTVVTLASDLSTINTINGIKPTGGVYCKTAATTQSGLVSAPGVDLLATPFTGSKIVPAGVFTVGDWYSIRLGGVVSANNNQSSTITVVATTTTILSLPVAFSNLTNAWWQVQIDFVIRAVGASGVAAIVVTGFIDYYSNPGKAGNAVTTVTTTGFDTTVQNELFIYYTGTSGVTSFRTDFVGLSKFY